MILEHFITLALMVSSGLAATYSCTATITDPSGTLTSPNYPHYYGNNENCQTNLTIPGAYSITLTVDDCSLEPRYDFLKVYSSRGDLLKSFVSSGQTLEIQEDSVQISFTTDGSGVYEGFSMHWQATIDECDPRKNDCGDHSECMRTDFFSACICDAGYEKVGRVCTRVSCGTPPFITNMDSQTTVTTGTKYLDTRNYTCLPGYELQSDSQTIICQANKSWTDPPICTKVDCGKPPEIEHGNLFSISDNTTFESIVTYVCNGLEYRMLGSKLVRCTEAASWSTLPLCYRVNCGSPPLVPNSKRQVSGHSYSDVANYSCNYGYEMDGDSIVTCQHTGHWTVPPECHAVSCDMPQTPENAGLVSITGTQFGHTAFYKCLPGYTTADSTHVTCQMNGEWSQAPNCTLDGRAVTGVNCGSPPLVPNSKRQVSGHSHSDVANYSCNYGYELDGDSIVTCKNTGYWTVPPECHEVSCEMPQTPKNAGLVSIAGTQFGHTAFYKCLPGYTTADSTHVTCQINGEWSHAPNCTLDERAVTVLNNRELSPFVHQTIEEQKPTKASSQTTNQNVLIACTVGVLVACVIIIVMLCYLFRRRKQMRRSVPTVNNPLYDPGEQEDFNFTLQSIPE